MPVVLAPDGTLGFGCNAPVSFAQARALRALGHRFAVRYIGREHEATHDLSGSEIDDLFVAGLGLMVVQHVESEFAWHPDLDKGVAYGHFAANTCWAHGIPAGTTVWLDLEGVEETVPVADIVQYCNAWFDCVSFGGYQPGLYVGWHSGLTPVQLYRNLKFTRYWGAYNLNRDEEPAVRGLCMKQRIASALEKKAVPFQIDGNTIRTDSKGDRPTLYVPNEFDPS